MTSNQNTLKNLARAKAVFQLRTLTAILTQMPVGSKPGQNMGTPDAQSGTQAKINSRKVIFFH